MRTNILNTVRDTISSYQMIDNDSPIVVGVSGGPDSMVLLDVLSKLTSNKLIVAHLNHRFRGEEADKDAIFVMQEAEKRGIVAEIKEYDVLSFMKEKKLGSQEAARIIRYNFYEDVANKYHSKIIALGHHANDQAETFIMRVIRGTGIHGLAGIPYTRLLNGKKVVRPLLDVTRMAIEEYIEKNSIPYRIDLSNLSTKYFRNEVRIDILPYLEKYNQKLVIHLQQLGKIIQDESTYLEKIVKDFFEEYKIEKNKNTLLFDSTQVQNLDIALQRRLIHLILRYLNLHNEQTYNHIHSILLLLQQPHPSKSVDLPGIRVYRNYNEIIFTSEPKTEIHYKENIPIPGELIISEAKLKIRAYVSNKREVGKGIYATFDYEKLEDKGLIAKSREIGDRIELLGLNGSKKLKDLFIDEKIPKEKRDRIPIIEWDNKILWVPGIKRSNHALVNEKTRSYLYLEIEELI